MADTITTTGIIATDPRHVVTSEGLAITSFRLAATQRYFDRKANAFVDGETNWYTVTAFRGLAINAVISLTKGDRLLVRGRLRIREWSDGERSGRVVEIEADAIGQQQPDVTLAAGAETPVLPHVNPRQLRQALLQVR